MTKGFTLIELLIVIGIIAILSVVVLITLNPAELLRQARDSTRISDLGTLKTAISLYLVDQSNVANLGDNTLCYAHTLSGVPVGVGITGCGTVVRFAGGTNTLRGTGINGTDGWVPVAFGAITAANGGPPISALPLDPTNTGVFYYAYRAGGTASCGSGANPQCGTYEINGTLESLKFAGTATTGFDFTDGGNSDTLYEIGTDPGLDL